MMMLPRLTMRVMANSARNTRNSTPQTTGLNVSAAPAPVSTDLPPLNPKNTGRLWPIMAKMAAR